MICDNCGGTNQATTDNGSSQWCLDCMRLAGLCISCAKPIKDVVEDYYNYESDECPACDSENNFYQHSPKETEENAGELPATNAGQNR